MSKLIQEARLVYGMTKSYLRQKAPYICDTVYGFIPHFLPGLAEIANGPIGVTEGMILMIDPEFAVQLEPEKLAGPVYHEVFHEVRDHLPRIKTVIGHHPNEDQMFIANVAADFTINPWLRDHKWWLPNGAYYPEDFDMPNDWMFEEYFHALCELKSTSPGKFKAPSFAAGSCGGCAGHAINKELEQHLDEQKGRGEADRIRIRNQTIREINQHIKSHGTGSVPGGFGQMIPFEHKESITPWNEELSHVVFSAFENLIVGNADFSLRRPSKRSYTRGIIRPGLVDYQPELVLIEDTSGSMGDEDIQIARNEEISVLQSLGITECWLIQADSAVSVEPMRVSLHDIPALKTHGRGGTDFRPALELCEKLDPHPDLALYLTDGYGPAPEIPPPDMEVVWVLVPPEGGARPADWGHLVIVSNDPEVRARFDLAA